MALQKLHELLPMAVLPVDTQEVLHAGEPTETVDKESMSLQFIQCDRHLQVTIHNLGRRLSWQRYPDDPRTSWLKPLRGLWWQLLPWNHEVRICA